jgi:fructose-bisphosphate aldolase class II
MVEGEIGIIGGSSELHNNNVIVGEECLTSVCDVKRFVKETKVDSLAVSIGNVHGVYKEMPELDIKRLEEIRKTVETIIVLHGGSGINQKEIREAIKKGITKININTELRVAWRKGLEKILKENKNETKPYKILGPLSEEIQKVVEDKIRLFGSNNKA